MVGCDSIGTSTTVGSGCGATTVGCGCGATVGCGTIVVPLVGVAGEGVGIGPLG